MTKYDFLHSTLRDINLKFEAEANRKEEELKLIEYQCWLSGVYVRDAIASAFNGNKYKYPENPLTVINKSPKEIAKKSGKTEEELRQEEAYASLLVKQANSNIAKKRKERSITMGEQA